MQKCLKFDKWRVVIWAFAFPLPKLLKDVDDKHHIIVKWEIKLNKEGEIQHTNFTHWKVFGGIRRSLWRKDPKGSKWDKLATIESIVIVGFQVKDD